LPSSSEENESKHSSDSSGKKNKQHLVKCIYCLRKSCEGCPLPFDDRTTLRNFLLKCKAPLKTTFYFKDDDEMKNRKPKSKSKSSPHSKNATKASGSAKKANKVNNDSLHVEEDENLDFELII
jgi:hypothetical protein